MSVQRVAVYVDGFNLFYGIRSKGWRHYYWLDPYRLAENLLRADQQLTAVRYFAARILPDPGGRSARQNVYLEALSTLSDLSIHLGYYVANETECRQCGASWMVHKEKMTDVNIAVELLGDAQDDLFDTALVISGDGDLAGPVTAVRLRHPGKRVVAAFPPDRSSFQLRGVATASFTIGRRALSKSQLPAQVTKSNDHVLERPAEWDRDN